MAKAYLMCGKICSGKSTFALELKRAHNAVVLSVDEITLALFNGKAGDKLDLYVERLERYLYKKSLDILEEGIDVVFDWGFWTRCERDEARRFFAQNNIEYEFHYISIEDDEWHRRIEKRNKAIAEGKLSAYYVDDGLSNKFEAIFEAPDSSENDFIIHNQR